MKSSLRGQHFSQQPLSGVLAGMAHKLSYALVVQQKNASLKASPAA